MIYHKYLKLASGDNIIAVTDDNCETFQNKEFLKIKNPVQIGLIRAPKNGMLVESHVFMPWIAISSVESVLVSTRNIIVAVDVEEKIAKQYDNYVKNVESIVKYDDETELLEIEDGEYIDGEDYDEEEVDDGEDGRTIH